MGGPMHGLKLLLTNHRPAPWVIDVNFDLNDVTDKL